MSIYSLIYKLAPFIFPVALGYALTRWLKFDNTAFSILVRNVLLPLVLFNAVATRFTSSFGLFAKIVASGAAVAIVGFLLFNYGNRLLKVPMGLSVSFPNVAYFAIPYVMLADGGGGIGTANAFLVGAMLSCFLIHHFQNGTLQQIIKEPWFYAVIIGMFFIFNPSKPSLLYKTINPLIDAAYPLLLVYLGSSLHPLNGIFKADVYLTIFFRLVCGFVIALVMINIFNLRGGIAEALMICALAPPTTLALAFNANSNVVDQGAAKLGVFVSFVLIALILYFRWRPWALF